MFRDPALRTEEVVGAPPRVDPLADPATGPRMREVVDRLRALHNVQPREEDDPFYATLARSPQVFTAFLELGTELSASSAIPPRDRELAILRTGWLCGAPFEWGEHVIVGRRIGLGDAEIERVTQGSAAAGWTPRERALLRAVEELHADAMIADATWAELELHFDERQLIELPMLVGHYHMTAFVQNALRIPLTTRNPGLTHR